LTHAASDDVPGADAPILAGEVVRLEPLSYRHVGGLVAAAAADPALYRWSPVPQGDAQAEAYVRTALAWQRAGSALPFATVRVDDDVVIGSTRFWNLERWSAPDGDGTSAAPIDACEIGYTWLAQSAIGTAANTEAKLLMLTHAFEEWRVARVCFHTDARNERSRAALAALPAEFEGVFRKHMLVRGGQRRDSAWYAVIDDDWPDVKENLKRRLATRPSPTSAGVATPRK
jgi:RimJ/RimL family protein N-acetyltransferase